jgi:hypothetical protein
MADLMMTVYSISGEWRNIRLFVRCQKERKLAGQAEDNDVVAGSNFSD